jgi:predicted nucleic acid-binding protein
VIIADTNVISELMKADPSPVVVAWVAEHASEEFRTTAVTLAEVLYGIERLPTGDRKATLRQTAADVFGRFAEDILPFDAAAATAYSEIVAQRDRQGAPIGGYDAQIAAICRTRGARLATRNTKDFEGTGVALINPWETG